MTRLPALAATAPATTFGEVRNWIVRKINCTGRSLLFWHLLLIPLLTVMVTTVRAELPQPLGLDLISPLDYRDVHLDDGALLDQVLEVKSAYLQVSDDDYLRGFRRRAGLPAPGHELGGWYAADRFIPFGQVLSGLARMYAGTRDEACRRRLSALVTGWGQCIEPDGYFFYSRNPNARHYGYEKMVCGLVDAHVYAANPDALGFLSRITDWAEKNLDRTKPYAFNGPGDPGEWYTLGENLYRAYLATGQTRYRDFARVWEYDAFWKSLRTGEDFLTKADHHHAYSHVNSLSSAAMAYRVSGDRQYLQTLVRGYNYLQRNQVFASGGYGPGEHLLPAAALATAPDDHPREDHFETQCASWAGFKLAKSLIRFTGEARYGDWVERLIINATGASLPVSPTGEVTYYSHYTLSGTSKNYSSGPWTCCSGTRIQAIADYHDLIYFTAAHSLYVNLYTPSTCSVAFDGVPVAIRQRTRFPEEENVEVTLSLPRQANFALSFRRPGWLAGPMEIRVNDVPVPLNVDPTGWAVIDRAWRQGDRVALHLPMDLKANPFPPVSPSAFPTAITFGPTVLAFSSPAANPVGKIDFKRPAASLIRVPGDELMFKLAADETIAARPLYAFKKDEPYFVYFDPARAWTRVPSDHLTWSSGWKPARDEMRVTSVAGAYAEFAFEGTAVRWVAKKFDDACIAEVSVDDQVIAVDLYAPRRGDFFQYDVRSLPPGKHTIRISATSRMNPKSKGGFLNIVRLEVIQSP